ncbi:acyltransferase family protein [Cellvibrio sp. QJXJ]|uniref:acyltransferase family protein n=1 Tax=Cellvibrio sp. QJXJ TaxID=2964606 RepID=UPI0021C3429F|nr:acyltransferase [Cellvibrio sp. QJXJ]UUA71425.1 acyltransferase [Cellvibrio sp. QJXJ]
MTKTMNKTVPEVKGQIFFIQALRAIAAGIVLLWHFKPTVTDEFELSLLNLFFANGFAGVDIFFVISGFIMVYSTDSLQGGKLSAVVFLAKRFTPIWPLYAFGTILYVLFLLTLDWLTIEELKRAALSLLFYPVLPHPTLDVGWTLNLEIFFYLLFSLCLLTNRFRWTIIFFYIVIFFLIKSNTIDYLEIASKAPVFSLYIQQAPHPCVLEFFLGAIIGKLFLLNISIPKHLGLSLTAILVSFSIWQYLSGFAGRPGIFGFGLGAIALVLGLAIAEKSGAGWKPNSILMWLGNISFSIYITHTVIGLSITRVLNNYGMSSYTNNIGYIIFLIFIILVFSFLTYELIEKRLSAKLSNILTNTIISRSSKKASSPKHCV